MPMKHLEDINELNGQAVVGSDGDKLGKVDAIYLDNDTSQPSWAAVKTGLLGGHVSLVPLAEADYDGTELSVPYDKAQLKNAPHHDPDHALSRQDESELFEHYGLAYGADAVTADPPGRSGKRDGARGNDDVRDNEGERGKRRDVRGEAGVQGHDTSGPTTDDAMTRSEEELNVGTRTQESGRVRLRKYVVTENVTQTVPVSHEEVRLEREPITEGNAGAANSGRDISEEEHEVTLHEEVPVTDKKTVAKERVRMTTDTVTEEATVSDSVRKEQIENPDVDDRKRR